MNNFWKIIVVISVLFSLTLTGCLAGSSEDPGDDPGEPPAKPAISDPGDDPSEPPAKPAIIDLGEETLPQPYPDGDPEIPRNGYYTVRDSSRVEACPDGEHKLEPLPMHGMTLSVFLEANDTLTIHLALEGTDEILALRSKQITPDIGPVFEIVGVQGLVTEMELQYVS